MRPARDGSSGLPTELHNRYESACFGVDREGVNHLEYRRARDYGSQKRDVPGAAEKRSGRAKTARIKPAQGNG